MKEEVWKKIRAQEGLFVKIYHARNLAATTYVITVGSGVLFLSRSM